MIPVFGQQWPSHSRYKDSVSSLHLGGPFRVAVDPDLTGHKAIRVPGDRVLYLDIYAVLVLKRKK